MVKWKIVGLALHNSQVRLNHRNKCKAAAGPRGIRSWTSTDCWLRMLETEM